MAEYWALPYQIWLIWGFIRIYNEKPIIKVKTCEILLFQTSLVNDPQKAMTFYPIFTWPLKIVPIYKDDKETHLTQV
jgi:hypothetical protein